MLSRRAVQSCLALLILVGFSGPALADDVVDGQLGPGALYRLVRPTNWNGSLLLYAHGFVSPDAPVALPAEAALFVSLLSPRGFALAFSSYSENGWSVKDGAQRTRQLLGIFAEKFGAPSRVYLGGASLGGLIAINLVEEHPDEFAGVLAACAVAGGTRAQFDYYANVRALFDVVYPGAGLAGNAGEVPADTDITTQIIGPATAAVATDGGAGVGVIARVNQTPLPFASSSELLESLLTALGGNAGSFVGLTPFMPSSRYFDNQDVVYSSALLPPAVVAGLNAAVGRFDASASALNYMEHFYAPTGALSVPMLMLSTSRDPVVPGFHQATYAALAAAAGHSDLLVRRTIDRYGHCTFTPTEIGAAVLDLVTWVQFGIKPTP